VFNRLAVRDGKIVDYDLRPPFDILFGMPRFEYGSLVEKTCSYSNLAELRDRIVELVACIT
jgi:hypothetical protein